MGETTFDMEVTYVSTEDDLVTGSAKVLDINRGGLALIVDKSVAVGELLSVKINPHTIQKHVKRTDVARDDRGRYLTKVLWVKPLDNSEMHIGTAFLLAP